MSQLLPPCQLVDQILIVQHNTYDPKQSTILFQTDPTSAISNHFYLFLAPSEKVITYFFILTSQYGRQFSFCLSNATTSICLLSTFPFFDLFPQFLHTIASLWKVYQEDPNELKTEVHFAIREELERGFINTRLQTPDLQLSELPLSLQKINKGEYVFSTEQWNSIYEIIMENHERFLNIFWNILEENRVVIHTREVTKISRMIGGLMCLLQPFEWQHIVVLGLPLELLSYCEAPMPFVIGVHTDLIPNIHKLRTEKICFYDLDSVNTIYHNEDYGRFSKGVEKDLTESIVEFPITAANIHVNNDAKIKKLRYAFRKIFLEIFRDYRKYISNEPTEELDPNRRKDAKVVFDRERFEKDNKSSKLIRSIINSQVCESFITELEAWETYKRSHNDEFENSKLFSKLSQFEKDLERYTLMNPVAALGRKERVRENVNRASIQMSKEKVKGVMRDFGNKTQSSRPHSTTTNSRLDKVYSTLKKSRDSHRENTNSINSINSINSSLGLDIHNYSPPIAAAPSPTNNISNSSSNLRASANNLNNNSALSNSTASRRQTIKPVKTDGSNIEIRKIEPSEDDDTDDKFIQIPFAALHDGFSPDKKQKLSTIIAQVKKPLPMLPGAVLPSPPSTNVSALISPRDTGANNNNTRTRSHTISSTSRTMSVRERKSELSQSINNSNNNYNKPDRPPPPPLPWQGQSQGNRPQSQIHYRSSSGSMALPSRPPSLNYKGATELDVEHHHVDNSPISVPTRPASMFSSSTKTTHTQNNNNHQMKPPLPPPPPSPRAVPNVPLPPSPRSVPHTPLPPSPRNATNAPPLPPSPHNATTIQPGAAPPLPAHTLYTPSTAPPVPAHIPYTPPVAPPIPAHIPYNTLTQPSVVPTSTAVAPPIPPHISYTPVATPVPNLTPTPPASNPTTTIAAPPIPAHALYTPGTSSSISVTDSPSNYTNTSIPVISATNYNVAPVLPGTAYLGNTGLYSAPNYNFNYPSNFWMPPTTTTTTAPSSTTTAVPAFNYNNNYNYNGTASPFNPYAMTPMTNVNYGYPNTYINNNNVQFSPYPQPSNMRISSVNPPPQQSLIETRDAPILHQPLTPTKK